MENSVELVSVYAKTEDGWKLVFKNIPENIALDIWRASFKTGENKISIERKSDVKFLKRQIEKLHKN